MPREKRRGLPRERTMICCMCEISGRLSSFRSHGVKNRFLARNRNQNEKVRDFRKDSNFIIFTYKCKTEDFCTVKIQILLFNYSVSDSCVIKPTKHLLLSKL